jgi:hypothetical protein
VSLEITAFLFSLSRFIKSVFYQNYLEIEKDILLDKINFQAVCGPNLDILNIVARWPGSVHHS